MSIAFRLASPEIRKREIMRLFEEGRCGISFTRKEVAALPELLADDEEVLALASGFMDGNSWLIALTDRQILFLDKGFLYGLRQVSIGLDTIHAIAGESGLMLGAIRIETGASTHRIENVSAPAVLPFTNKVRDAITKRQAARHQPAENADDSLAKLERLSALREKGALSDEEFATLKAKILNR